MAEAIVIRLVLDGDIKTRFDAVRDYHGCKVDTEVIRRLINDEFHRINNRKGKRVAAK